MFNAFVDCEAITECVSPQIYKDIVPLYMKKYGKKRFNKNKPKRFQSQKTDLKQIDNLVTKHERIIKRIVKSPEIKVYSEFPTFRSFNATPLKPNSTSFLTSIDKGVNNNERIGNYITLKYLKLTLEVQDNRTIMAPISSATAILENIFYARVMVVLDRDSEGNYNATNPLNELIYALFQVNLETDVLPIQQQVDPFDPQRFKILKDRKFKLCKSVSQPQWGTDPNQVAPASTGEYRHMVTLKCPVRNYKVVYNELDIPVHNEIYVIWWYENTGATGQSGIKLAPSVGYTDQ